MRRGLGLLVAAALAGSAEGLGQWCVSEKSVGGHKREPRGSFRDFHLYAGVGPVEGCRDFTQHEAGNDGLWVLEFDGAAKYNAAKSRVMEAGLSVFHDSGKLSFVCNGGVNLTNVVGLDACGGEIDTSVIPVAASRIVPLKGISDTMLARGNIRNDPVIAGAVGAVKVQTLEDVITHLQSYQTRNSFSSVAAEAGRWLEDQYLSFGFDTELHRFRNDMPPNLIATKYGTTTPNKVIVVGAHFDSRSTDTNSPTMRAPGADDNASGTSAMLEIARIIHERGLTFDYTIKICAFSGEEQGLLGSAAQAALWKQQGLDIVAMFNADMLGWQIPDQPITMGFKDKSIDVALTEQVMELTTAYTGLPTAYSASCCSDYKSFYEQGFSAVGFFENAVAASSYPHYHKSTDLLEYVNTEQLALEVQAIVATVLTYAGVEQPANEVIPNKSTYVYLAPADVLGGALVPGMNRTVVATFEKLQDLPVGWSLIKSNPSVPKYLVRSRHAHDRENLKKAYGSDLVQLSEMFFVLSTDEVGERKAHSCGILMLKPMKVEGVMQVPKKGTNAEKSNYMAKVDQSLLEPLLRQLSGEEPVRVGGSSAKIPTRYSYSNWNQVAADWISHYLEQEAGCDEVLQEEFSVWGRQTRNVICVKIGENAPGTVVLGAHFDSISSVNGNSEEYAPGAVDNGSGSATVMAVATALKDLKNKHPIHFILFSGEEQGLYGSTHYVDVAQKMGTDIKVALIMDMTAYSSKHFGVTFEGTTSPAILEVMANAEENVEYLKSTLGTELTTNHATRSFGSDHVPFQKAGIPAILLIEQDDTDYPGYHRTTDTVAYANYNQMRDIGRVILGQVVDYSS